MRFDLIAVLDPVVALRSIACHRVENDRLCGPRWQLERAFIARTREIEIDGTLGTVFAVPYCPKLPG
jgi:hypothetical protein